MNFVKVETKKGNTVHINANKIIGIGEYEASKWSIIFDKEMALEISEDEAEILLLKLGSMK